MIRAVVQETRRDLDLEPRKGDKSTMNRTSILIALATAAVAFSIAIFGQPGTALTPPADAFPLFALLTLLEALAFGAGVAYVLRARRVLFAGGTAPLERA